MKDKALSEKRIDSFNGHKYFEKDVKEAVEKLKSKRNNGDFVHIREIDKIFGSFE